MSLLTIIQRAAKRTRLFSSPSTVIGNTDTFVVSALEMLTEIGDELVAEFDDWQFLQKEQTFNTAASTADYPIANIITNSDFSRLLSNTAWNQTNNRQITIVNLKDWQRLQKEVGTNASIDDAIIYKDSNLSFFPTPSAVETISIYYRSKFWITDSGGTAKDQFTVDTDLTLFDEELLYLGLVAMLKQDQGIPHLAELDRFERRKDMEKAKQVPFNDIRDPIVIFPFANTGDTNVGQ